MSKRKLNRRQKWRIEKIQAEKAARAEKKASHIEPGAGHYGIFAGKSWRNNIRPLVLDFIDANTGGPANTPKAPAKRKAPAKKTAPKKTAAK